MSFFSLREVQPIKLRTNTMSRPGSDTALPGRMEHSDETTALLVLAIGLIASACSATVLELEVGTCFDDPDTFEEVEDVPIVECEDPHDNEVIANHDLTGSDYPGQEQTENRASQICYDSFADYVGIAYEESIYDIGLVLPNDRKLGRGGPRSHLLRLSRRLREDHGFDQRNR